MASDGPAKELAWRQLGASLLLVSGIGLIAWSFIWANVSNGREAWSQEQALEYKAAAARLHSLSHEFAHEAQHGNEEALQAELDEAKTDYQALLTQLESAMGRPKRIAWFLRLGGAALLVGGAVLLIFERRAKHRQGS